MIVAIALSTTLNAKLSQDGPCDTIQHPLNYSTGNHTFCAAGTFNYNQSQSNWLRISAQYGDTSSYAFSVNGSTPVFTTSVIFTPSLAGLTHFTLFGTGKDIHGNTCRQSVSWTFTTVICSQTYSPSYVGIQEIELIGIEQAECYDLRGNKIEKRFNELIIEQIGTIRRKILFQR